MRPQRITLAVVAVLALSGCPADGLDGDVAITTKGSERVSAESPLAGDWRASANLLTTTTDPPQPVRVASDSKPTARAEISPTTVSPSTTSPPTTVASPPPPATTEGRTCSGPNGDKPPCYPSECLYSGKRAVSEAHYCWDEIINWYPWEDATAFGYMFCESEGDPYADNPSSSANGLFQILGGSMDPLHNVNNAYQMWLEDGWGPWSSCA